jgi:chemotaxis signal transduction protein
MPSSLAIPSPVTSTDGTDTYKAVVFAIAQHYFALPVAAIFRVVQCSPELSYSMQNQELVLLDNQPLTFLDLHPILSKPGRQKSTTELPAKYAPCLVVTHCQQGNLCAIAADQPPSLLELSLANTHPLPPDYRQAIAHIASHVAILPHQRATLNILLLDLQQALHCSSLMPK